MRKIQHMTSNLQNIYRHIYIYTHMCVCSVLSGPSTGIIVVVCCVLFLFVVFSLICLISLFCWRSTYLERSALVLPTEKHIECTTNHIWGPIACRDMAISIFGYPSQSLVPRSLARLLARRSLARSPLARLPSSDIDSCYSTTRGALLPAHPGKRCPLAS